MILQNVVLPTQKDEKTQKLYYRVSGGRGKVSIGETMVFAGRRRVVFDTYMNCFSVAKWYRYAGLREISLEVALRGGHDNKREGLVFGGRGPRVFCPFSDKIAAKRLTAGKCNPLILTVFPLRIALATNILSVVRLCA